MPPDQVAALLRALTDFRTEVREHIADLRTEVREDLDEIKAEVRKTNGRVNSLEREKLLREGAALQKAATIEETRDRRATDIARNAWIRPGLMALLAAVSAVFLDHTLH